MSEPSGNPDARVALFQSREIRRTLHNDEWWFVITDIELILTMLAEATTTKLHRDRDSKGMMPLKKDAKDGAQWRDARARILRSRPASR
jgi:prophage antirepressor-like protein